jgi:hypothetical protein
LFGVPRAYCGAPYCHQQTAISERSPAAMLEAKRDNAEEEVSPSSFSRRGSFTPPVTKRHFAVAKVLVHEK